uniref:Uncharacterized protein n=1 Tax=Glossina austeni TaxID=7395 RepID=A0A1A9VA85_GLOAU
MSSCSKFIYFGHYRGILYRLNNGKLLLHFCKQFKKVDKILLKETNAMKSFIKKVDNERTNERTPALLTYINETRCVLSKTNQPSKYKEIELKSHLSVELTYC